MSCRSWKILVHSLRLQKHFFFWKSLRILWFVEKTWRIMFLDSLDFFIPVPLHRISEQMKIEFWFLQQNYSEWWAELINVPMFSLSPSDGMIWWLQMIFAPLNNLLYGKWVYGTQYYVYYIIMVRWHFFSSFNALNSINDSIQRRICLILKFKCLWCLCTEL